MMKNLLIRTKLVILLISVSLILISIGSFTYYSINEISNLSDLQLLFKDLQNKTIELRKHEKDFLLREKTNKEFFKTGESKYLSEFNSTFKTVTSDLQKLKQNKYIRKYSLTDNIEELEELYTSYSKAFMELSNKIKIRGFKDYGSVGKLRDAIHQVEFILKKAHTKDITISMLSLRRHEKDYLLRKDLEYKREFTDEIDHFINILKYDLVLDFKTKQTLREKIAIYKKTFFRVVDDDIKIGMTEQKGLRGSLRTAVHQVSPIIVEIEKILSREIKSSIQTNIKSTIIFIVVGIIISIFLLLVIISSITKSLNYANIVIERISKGDLTKTIDINGKDEIAIMMNNLNSMSNKLKEVIASIIEGSNYIVLASEQISSAAQEMSQGASEHASSTEEASSSMEQMAATIQQNSNNSQQTYKIANKASEKVQIGSKAVNATVNSMKTIAKKIAIISEIANQTNILAINAAVEAARAEKYGKGFAVIAREIRELAQKSDLAAKEIVELTSESLNIADETGKVFVEIVSIIQNTAKLVEEISASSVEQNNGVNQINLALQELNQVSMQNAAGVEELASNAEETNAQARQLQDVVAYFKVDNLKTIKSKNTKFAHTYKKDKTSESHKEEYNDNEFERF